MAEVWNLCQKLVIEIKRINSNRIENKMSKSDFKKLVNEYIDEIWK